MIKFLIVFLLSTCLFFRDDAVINGSFNRWFKFNDTTVESVEMTEHFMETELFGGKYTAKSEKSKSTYIFSLIYLLQFIFFRFSLS